MKKATILISAAILLLSSCAKSVVSTTGEDARRTFEAWVEVNGEGWKKTPMGNYIISETAGTGIKAGTQKEHPFVRFNYSIYDLKGNLTQTTDPATARQWGRFSHKYYFGPEIFERQDNAMFAGIDEIIENMKVGGKCRFVIPGWLITTSRYSSADGYVLNYDGTTKAAIYEIELVDAIEDIEKWELGVLKEYVDAHYPEAKTDTTGFYKVVLKEAKAPFTKDSTIYINYTGRLLSGEVFDTTIRDTANLNWKENFDKTKSFNRVQVNWKKDESKITMTSSETTIIPGFAHLLHSMGVYEKALGLFYSTLGYTRMGSTDANGTTIPSYSPLIFEVEAVDK